MNEQDELIDVCLRCGGEMDEGDPEFCSLCEPEGSPSSFRTLPYPDPGEQR